MSKITFKDTVQAKLMNSEFDFYFLEQRNQILIKKKDNADMSFLISLDQIEVQ